MKKKDFYFIYAHTFEFFQLSAGKTEYLCI